jgi:Metallo-peptidase family M12/FG-GAP-like repeat/Calx-beta domain
VNSTDCKSVVASSLNFFRLLILILGVGITPMLFAAATTPVPMLVPIPFEYEVYSAQGSKSATLAHAKGVKTATTTIGFNAVELHSMPVGAESLLTLPSGRQFVVIKRSQVNHADGSVSWVGYLRDAGMRYKVIATTGVAGTFASIETPDEEWAVAPGGGTGFDFLLSASAEAKSNPTPGDANDFRISHKSADETSDPDILPSTYLQNAALKNEIAERMRFSSPLSSLSKITPTPQVTIDVLVVVTKGFADFHGAGMDTRINQLFATANAAYASSESAMAIRRIGAVQIKDYSDTATTKDVALTDVGNNKGVFADIENVRASVGADLVALLRNVNDGGIAYIGQVNNVGTGTESWNNPRFMYSVTGICNFGGTGCDSVFAHELGHNMGLQHDRANAGTNTFGTRPYSFGWKINANNAARDFRTIMSYAPPSGRALVFSNPNLFICNPSGWAPPDACGNVNSEDNARVLNENRFMLAAIKTASGVAINPKLVLTADRTRYPAAAGTATVKVTRLGDPAGAVSVNYATANGSAVAGADFTAASGTLSWAANDTATKTINIPILQTSGLIDKTFSVSLSGAVGPTGTAIALPSTVTVTLTAAGVWPPGNVVPAGWAQPPGTNAAWSVVDTDASEGTYSLKSGTIIDSQEASIQFTANMKSGILRFYRKVSSEETFDFFRVYVDGTEVNSAAASGESNWTWVNIPITAGSHTIKFSYIKDNAVGTGGDAAWIDQLSLPLASSTDLSGDSKSDLLIQSTAGTTTAWLMNGTAISSTASLLSNDPSWTISHTGDFNGDGKADILWRSNEGAVTMWLMNGNTIISAVGLLGPDANWRVSHVGDFNGDGKTDLLWRSTNGAVTMWLMNGTAITSTAGLLGPDPNWSVSHTADFNGDGKADLLWRNTNGAVTIWLMSGTTTLSAAGLLGPDPNWSVSHTADFNGDGKADLLWRSANGAVTIWLMNGAALSSAAGILGANPDWRISHTGDFNGDGNADLLWRNNNGAVTMWLMDGATTITTAGLIGADANWRVSHINDLNGDGKADLIWRNLDGSITAWVMNGTSPSATAGLTGAGTLKVVP